MTRTTTAPLTRGTIDVTPIQFEETAQDGVSGKTTSELQTPTDYTGIYGAWDDDPDLDLDNVDEDDNHGTGQDAPWYFGENDEYPVLKIDVDRDGDVDQDDYDAQQPTSGPPRPPPPSRPDTPQITEVQRGNTQLTVKWTKPADGGSAITAYEVQYRVTGTTDADWSSRSTPVCPATSRTPSPT